MHPNISVSVSINDLQGFITNPPLFQPYDFVLPSSGWTQTSVHTGIDGITRVVVQVCISSSSIAGGEN